MSTLEEPAKVVLCLLAARTALGQAHEAASETEGDRHDLNGPVRDAIFGIGTTVDALASMIEEGRFNATT